MENSYQEKYGFWGGVAKVLNFTGSMAVQTYDFTAHALDKTVSAVKKMPRLPVKAKGMFTSGLGIIKTSEAKQVWEKINEYEQKIKKLYFEIGKEGAGYDGEQSPLETETVKKLILDVREYEKEIQRLENRIAEITERKQADALRKKERREAAPVKKHHDKATDAQVVKSVKAAIAQALKSGAFETRSEMEIFDNVANDLLDSEMEVKILSAAELGKIGNEAAVPVLMEAVKFEAPDLDNEIINSLIAIGDERAIPLFEQKADSANFSVRIGCLRGLYKMADEQKASPVLLAALRDQHAKVRQTAATFIGWKDFTDAVPALVQSLRDKDAGVRKAAVSALANIKDETSVLPLIKMLGDSELAVREKAIDALQLISGEDITFDIHASGSALTDAISGLRQWWQTDGRGGAELAEAVGAGEAEEAEEAAAEIEEAEEAAAVDEEAEEEDDGAEEAALDTTDDEDAESETLEQLDAAMDRMTKAELLEVCEQRGLAGEMRMTKAEIKEIILGESR